MRYFYVRAATEAVAAHGAMIRSAGVVGWTYPQTIEWIDQFYSSEKSFRQLPVAVVFTYAMRARGGENRETLLRDARATVENAGSVFTREQTLSRLDPAVLVVTRC